MLTRVALVVPKANLKGEVSAPLSLAYLASYLRIHGNVEVKIFDGTVNADIESDLFLFQPDVVGITATTPQAPAAYQLADSIKRNRPDVTVVLGGVHASALPHEAAEHADYVVVGEGEKALADIVNGKPLPKIIYGVETEELDSLPSPAFDLLQMKSYFKTSFPSLQYPTASLVTSRGCPFQCPFCHNSTRFSKPRWFSANRVANEVELLVEKYGVKSILFHDDEFLVNKKRLRELAKLFKERGISERIVWGCKSRVNTIDKETVETAKKMGCVSVFLGVESGSQRTLDYLKCRTTRVEDAEKAVKLLSESGITVCAGFIFGSPTETLEEMRQTLNWFENTKGVSVITINSLTPFPGTEVWRVAQENRLIPEKIDYRRLASSSVVPEIYMDKAVPFKDYVKFMVGVYRKAWFLSQSRLQRKRLWKTKTWWWLLFRYPAFMVKHFGG